MDQFDFSKKDLDQIKEIGQTPAQIDSQLLLFHRGAPFVNIDRPCTVGDGIKKLTNGETERSIRLYETEGVRKKLIKFVPASGAATRMFKPLIQALHEQQSADPGPVSDDLSFFMHNCRRLAFYDDLKASLAREELNLETLLATQDHESILTHLLTEKYLNYAMLPKGLIPFHAYDDTARTAFEEHLVEAAGYIRTDTDECRLHFTVSPQHLKKFLALFEHLQPAYEQRYGAKFLVSFSIQEEKTNTIAVDMENRPFRLPDGRLLFRPGGHGALINNLNRLDSDLVYIKNIDNVAHERFIPEMIEWKKILCGYLLHLQQQIFRFLHQLHQPPVSPSLIRQITEFLASEFFVQLPKEFKTASDEHRQETMIRLLNRPLRVCGMVSDRDAPGGGPFWIKSHDAFNLVQIVEAAQIDTDDPAQQAVLMKKTHFNPVDLVCGIKNWRGNSFDLSEYVDHEAVFITSKSENGRNLKALELPGLWNGAMAFWNTVFVEVPEITFNPVKVVTDLLGTHHQPAD